jgi:hypothetical protein
MEGICSRKVVVVKDEAEVHGQVARRAEEESDMQYEFIDEFWVQSCHLAP